MKSLPDRLTDGDVLVADGATGTNLQRMGLGLGVAPEEWVLDEPQHIVALHRAFVEAGADIVLTCTFGGTRIRMRDSKYAERAPEVNRRAVLLARQAATGHSVLVAGSMGPTGMLMEPFGDLTPAQCVQTYAEQAEALSDSGVDFLLLETFFALEEALAAIQGVQQVSRLPLVVSFSFDQGTRTMMGLRVREVVEAIEPLGVTAIGANCGKTLDSMMQIVTELSADAHVPLWIKPNAGLPRMVGDVAAYDVTPAIMAEFAQRYVCAGARVVGGCCGSTPEHVAAIARAVKSPRSEPQPFEASP